LKNQEDEKNAECVLRRSAYASLLIVEFLMNLSNFESPDSKNLAGSSRVSGLKRFDKRDFSKSLCFIPLE
jgi:hypothetical protein